VADAVNQVRLSAVHVVTFHPSSIHIISNIADHNEKGC